MRLHWRIYKRVQKKKADKKKKKKGTTKGKKPNKLQTSKTLGMSASFNMGSKQAMSATVKPKVSMPIKQLASTAVTPATPKGAASSGSVTPVSAADKTKPKVTAQDKEDSINLLSGEGGDAAFARRYSHMPVSPTGNMTFSPGIT